MPNIKTYQKNLLTWYQQNARSLPWRETNDPYKIWVSEIMLQQTRVETVIDYYLRFIRAFPDVYSLAKAKEDEVLKLWEGLGYYSRARRMIHCAHKVVTNYKGKFPSELKKIIQLPGIGSYTAGAILSIAFNQPVPAVDGNVMRIISRQFNIDIDISQAKSKKFFEEKVFNLLPKDRRSFNQALMELGATICKPKNPLCNLCPVASLCEAHRLGIEETLPVKTKKMKKEKYVVAVAYIQCNDKILLTKRESTGLLGGLWGFPLVEIKHSNKEVALKEEIEETYGLEVQFVKTMGSATHIFTHKIWEMDLLAFETDQCIPIEYPISKWINKKEISEYPLPTAFKKLL